MKDFKFYLEEGKLKQQTPDENLAESLKKDSLERIKKIKQLDQEIFAKIIFENAYDALRDLCDSILALKNINHIPMRLQ